MTYFEKITARTRTRIIRADGEVNMPAALIGLLVPATGAFFCYTMLTPAELNVSDSIKALAASLRWLFLGGLVLNSLLLITMFAATLKAVAPIEN